MKYEINKAKSGIHIKPENKGKFTATKKKTGKTTEELTHSKNPVTKKRAVFAQNAKKWKHKDGGNIDFLQPFIEKFKLGGKTIERKDECVQADNDFGKLMLKFLWVRDQAHVFHWQAKFNHHHVNLGDFYEEYLEELDELAESIFGKKGQTFTIGEGSIKLMDYSEESLMMYLDKIPKIFTEEFSTHFPENKENIGLYHTLGDILELISKLKYLLSQK